MNHYLKLKLFETANRVLRHSVQALKSKSLPLWKTISGIFLKLDDQKWIEDLYTRGIASVYTEISVTFRIPYLNWCYKKKGRSMARKLFQNIKDLQPGQPELFLYMISLEKSCNRLKNDVYINKLYFELCTKFGSHRMDIWYHAIKYNHEENNENDVARLCTTADSILPQHLKDELKDKLKIIARKPPLKIKVASPTILI
ncbi:uncharacterized protein LOC112691699 [Sipha flava]|uniref:Uncharacterized protein LOC112691699 n=1 Tax=Sipha flava TaxID=143950 RepID=A0A8B8GFV5_9HEMI|nr:uncharacterized protein LOC112691699 [Sipha flava]